jgi:hypothetical protein
MRRRRVVFAVAAATVLSGLALVAVHLLLRHVTPVVPECQLGDGPAALLLSTDQAANATTIAAVAKREALPDHAVTIALATALQESKLQNLPFGDRDSVGLFQQRPSQGWGRRAQLLQPAFAAAAFYDHLRQVPGWQTLPVTVAAQSVQHSADGSGYAQWEEEARSLARVLTGELPAGLNCQFPRPHVTSPGPLALAVDRELGTARLSRWTRSTAAAGPDWTVAEWLVGHAYRFGVVKVWCHGRVWSNASGRWAPGTDAGNGYLLARVPA